MKQSRRNKRNDTDTETTLKTMKRKKCKTQRCKISTKYRYFSPGAILIKGLPITTMRTKERDKGQYYDRVNLVDSLYILGQLDIHTINTDINTGYKYYKYYTYVMYTYIYKYINTRGQFDVGYKLVNYQVDRRKEKEREEIPPNEWKQASRAGCHCLGVQVLY